jgi:hypothetical protein
MQQCVTTNNNDDSVPPTRNLVLVAGIEGTPPSPTTNKSSSRSSFIVGDEEKLLVLDPLSTISGCRQRSTMSAVSDSRFPKTSSSSPSVDEALQRALDISGLNDPESPVFTSNDIDVDHDDEDDDEVISKEDHRRDLLKDDMSLFYRELSRLRKTNDGSFSLPSDSDLEEEDHEDYYYIGSASYGYYSGGGSMDFAKGQTDFNNDSS